MKKIALLWLGVNAAMGCAPEPVDPRLQQASRSLVPSCEMQGMGSDYLQTAMRDFDEFLGRAEYVVNPAVAQLSQMFGIVAMQTLPWGKDGRWEWGPEILTWRLDYGQLEHHPGNEDPYRVLFTRSGAQWLALQMGGQVGFVHQVEDLKLIGSETDPSDFDEYLRPSRTGLVGGLVNIFDGDNLPAIQEEYANGALYDCVTDESQYSDEFTESPYDIDNPFNFRIHKSFLELWKNNSVMPTGVSACPAGDQTCQFWSSMMRWGRPMSPMCRSESLGCGVGAGMQVFERAVFRFGHIGAGQADVAPLGALIRAPEERIAACTLEAQDSNAGTSSDSAQPPADENGDGDSGQPPPVPPPAITHNCALSWPYVLAPPTDLSTTVFQGFQACVEGIWRGDIADNGNPDLVTFGHSPVTMQDGSVVHGAMGSMNMTVNFQGSKAQQSAALLQTLKDDPGAVSAPCVAMVLQAKSPTGSEFEIIALQLAGSCSNVPQE